MNIISKLKDKWRKYQTRRFVTGLRKRLLKLDDYLYSAGWNRHERRQLQRDLVRDIESAIALLGNNNEKAH